MRGQRQSVNGQQKINEGEELYFTGESSESESDDDDDDDDDDDELYEADEKVSDLEKALILSLNTCYHVGLQNEKMRKSYLDGIVSLFNSKYITRGFMEREINACYEVFLDEIHLPNAIARNQVIILQFLEIKKRNF